MAIVRVNTTTVDVTGQPFGSFGIPTVAAGNTIIILTGDGFFQTPSVPSVSDNAGNTYTLQTSAFTGTVGNPNRRNARIWTAFNTAGGASSIFINWGIATNARVTVLEYSGIKTVSPVESTWQFNNFAMGGGGVNGPVTHGGMRWNLAFSLLLSVNSDNSTNISAINGAATPPGGAWNLVATNRATYGGSVCDKVPSYNNPGPGGTVETQGLTGNGTGQCWTSIVILRADLTLSCNESMSMSDTDVQDVEQGATTETINMSDFVDLILSTLNHFKTLLDMINSADSISLLSIYQRTLQEQISLVDTFSSIHEGFITKTESINAQDWLGIKKTNSTHWGS